jgi:hypothetical protein
MGPILSIATAQIRIDDNAPSGKEAPLISHFPLRCESFKVFALS